MRIIFAVLVVLLLASSVLADNSDNSFVAQFKNKLQQKLENTLNDVNNLKDKILQSEKTQEIISQAKETLGSVQDNMAKSVEATITSLKENLSKDKINDLYENFANRFTQKTKTLAEFIQTALNKDNNKAEVAPQPVSVADQLKSAEQTKKELETMTEQEKLVALGVLLNPRAQLQKMIEQPQVDDCKSCTSICTIHELTGDGDSQSCFDRFCTPYCNSKAADTR